MSSDTVLSINRKQEKVTNLMALASCIHQKFLVMETRVKLLFKKREQARLLQNYQIKLLSLDRKICRKKKKIS